jgi:hypothetical protein
LNEKFIANGEKQEGNSNYRGKIEKLAVKKFFVCRMCWRMKKNHHRLEDFDLPLCLSEKV